MPAIRHHKITVDGLGVFIREAGDPAKPAIVLPPSASSSTRAYVRLIDQLGIGDYAFDMFGFGAPVGFRIALEHDQRVRGTVTQNGNAYPEGLGEGLAALRDWWGDREAGQAAVNGFVSLAGTQLQWQAGARDPEHIDPEQALADQAILDLPGRADYMKALLWDYQNNPGRYPDWQAWLRRRQPRLLAAWGKNDPFFTAPGTEAYRNDVPGAEIVLLDTCAAA